ncbi:hypothetical protein PS173_005012 [Salmonella enterica]|nr:hypothetical protein [Salmonella enterica]
MCGGQRHDIVTGQVGEVSLNAGVIRRAHSAAISRASRGRQRGGSDLVPATAWYGVPASIA